MNTETKQQHHFFASTAFNWATASTRAEAVAKVARAAGADLIKRNVKAHGGLYVWTVQVNTPEDQHYTINNYAPNKLIVDGQPTTVQVPVGRPMEFDIVNTKGHVAVRN